MSDVSLSPQDDEFSAQIEAAVREASAETFRQEGWSRRGSDASKWIMHKSCSILAYALNRFGDDDPKRELLRGEVIRFINYAHPDTRLRFILMMSQTSPDILDELFSAPIKPAYEPYRYNLFTLMGAFARHGLIAQVMQPERISRVKAAIAEEKFKKNSS